jgi:hypothetical protein
MQDGLSLLATAFEIAFLAVLADRRHMPPDGAPSPDLPRVVVTPAAHIVPAVPLKPAARILRMDPSVSTPLGERERSLDAKKIDPRMPLRAELCPSEPALRELRAAVSHVFSAEHSEFEHLLWCEFRLKCGRKIPADRVDAVIRVAVLHPVVDDDSGPHTRPRCPSACARRAMRVSMPPNITLCTGSNAYQ